MSVPEGESLTVPPNRKTEASQPRWRRDFPIDWPQDEYVSRRDFTRFMVLTSLAFTVGQFWILLQNRWRSSQGALPIVAIAKVDDLAVGDTLSFTYPNTDTPCVLVRLDESHFVAFDRMCTHLLCPVLPETEHSRFHCPCHNGSFDLATGRPIAGPPQRPLTPVTLSVRNGTVYATGKGESLA